jgi:hypothetical protein
MSQCDGKKQYEVDEDSPNLLSENIHQMPDNPSTFMTRIRERSLAKIAANDERRQVLNPRVTWGGSIDLFEVFRNNVESHYGQSGSCYLFDPDFQVEYFERVPDYFVDFLNEAPSTSQIKKDTRALYGALLSACQGGVGQSILMENRLKQDGIWSWYQLVNQYETESNQNVRIKKLENVIATVYHRHYMEGLFKWIQNYEDAFTELSLLGDKVWDDDGSKKRRFFQNTQNIGMLDTVFKELVRNKSFIETCNILRSHAVIHDQQSKDKATRQVNANSQSTASTSSIKKDKTKQVLALINELQIQDSTVIEDEVASQPSTKTAMICKLAQVHYATD